MLSNACATSAVFIGHERKLRVRAAMAPLMAKLVSAGAPKNMTSMSGTACPSKWDFAAMKIAGFERYVVDIASILSQRRGGRPRRRGFEIRSRLVVSSRWQQ
ncbi:MAG: hypothetical protein CO108_07200 [Deltaproteobacteria bacterium CG_4_9_14_3_um_filter_63_12]|nr:MAG: hypothetical protein CO108_07200 [Deltaproteobacteria bacterium CG_4_9_14_3_um_filter_63_12]